MDAMVEVVLGLLSSLLLAGAAWGSASSWPSAQRGDGFVVGRNEETTQTKGGTSGRTVGQRKMA